MTILYPWLDQEIGQLVLWICLLAGFASALVNGITSSSPWLEAGTEGCSSVAALAVSSALRVLRSMVLGVFAGTVTFGLLSSKTKYEQSTMVALAGLAAFVADPVLTWIKGHVGRVIRKFFGSKAPSAEDEPQGRGSGGTLD
jgi:hypothetical protein